MNSHYIYHNSQDLSYRIPFGAVQVNSEVLLFLYAYNDIKEVYLDLINFNGLRRKVKMEKHPQSPEHGVKYFAKIILREEGIFQYYFSVVFEDGTYYYGNNAQQLGGIGEIYHENPKMYQITVYKPNKVANWFKEGVMYQIFVDRFYNGNEDGLVSNPKSNSFIYGRWEDEPMYITDTKGDIKRWDFYGGNLKGVLKKLPYLKELGVSIIYLNPIFKAVSNHKYDTGDYKQIDEMFGNEDLFKQLCEKAKEEGISIILDGVFSHTGADSVYFNKYGRYRSLGAYQSKESPYYNWYIFKSYPDSYDSWWGFETLPNVNELYPDYVDFIISAKNSVIGKWMKLGVKGWRLDVADELPDEFIRLLKERVRIEDSEGIVIGEVWEDASNKISYGNRRRYFLGEELDSVTNYPLREAIIAFLTNDINSELFNKKIMSLKENYPSENFQSLMNLIGTHDTKRIITELKKKELLYLAVTMQMTMVGVPIIYYGDEVGVDGGTDPSNRKTYPWGKEDKKILNKYKKLVQIRNSSKILKKGDIEFIACDSDVICYKRQLDDKNLFILINRNPKEIKKVFVDGLSGEIYRTDMITGRKKHIDHGTVSVEPLEGVILEEI